MKFFASTLLLFLLFTCSDTPQTATEAAIPTAKERLQELAARAIANLDKVPLDSMAIPRSLNEDGSLHTVKSRDWTSGFYPGMLWQLYAVNQDPELERAARAWTAFIEKEKYDDHTHDLGFKLYCSFGEGFKLTQDEHYKDVIVTASETLIQRYNDTVGCIRSWDFNTENWDFPVIIDNMMNLEMLFAATRFTDDIAFYKVANQHALTTMKNHFRADYGSYHVIDYNPTTGAVRKRNTHQGSSDDSAWARGQAWGLHGFATAYRETGNPAFLDRAREIADFIFNHLNLPEDEIPYWDYNAANIPDEPRDVSAAAITASGLLELAKSDPVRKDFYLSHADKILTSLMKEEYQSDEPPFFLQHSTGGLPNGFEIDVPIIYADYYYVEALRRRASLE